MFRKLVMALGAVLAVSPAHADFVQLDGFIPVIDGATRSITYYPLPNTSTTTNGATFSEVAGRANVTLGGNGNSEGALLLTYNFSPAIDLTDGGTNTQFFLVMDRIERALANPGDTALSLTITARDTSGVNGTYNTGIGSVPDGQSMVLNFDCSVNPVCFSPTPNFASINRITVRLAFPQNYAAANDTTEVDMDSIYVTPTGGSFPPVFTSGGTSASYREGVAGSPVTFAASGVPEPVITFSGALPAGVTWNGSTYTISGTPAAGTMGVYQTTVTATNSAGSAGRTFTLNVEGPPEITSANNTLFNEGQANSFTVTADGVPAPTFSVIAGSLPSGVTLSAAGALSGTPVDATESSYAITIEADNGISPTDTQAFVLDVNRAPRIANLELTGEEDVGVQFNMDLLPATEPDGQAVFYLVDTLPANGSLLLAGNAVSAGDELTEEEAAALSFSPDANWNGTTSFNWRASDGVTTSTTASVSLVISPVNDAPVIQQGGESAHVIDEDTSLNQVLTASDQENNPLFWSIIKTPSGGGAQVTEGGAVTYTPDADFNGSDTFDVAVSDGGGGFAVHTFNVTVNPINDIPVIFEGASVQVVMNEDGAPQPFILMLNANDPDQDQALNWSVSTAPGHGTAGVTRLGSPVSVNYSPQADYVGSDSFVVRVDDAAGGTADITVNVTLEPVNDAPSITGSPVVNAVEGQVYSFMPVVTDPDGDVISFSLSGQPAWAALDPVSGEVTGTPGHGDIGSYQNIILGVSDGTLQDSLTFSINVLADLDGDGIADVDDPDIDGDGMLNVYEQNAGLNPRDPSDATRDLDGDGVSNLDEFLAASNAARDDYPPVVSALPVAEVDAAGLFTLVDLGDGFAIDGRDGEVPLLPSEKWLAPGDHTVERKATDAAGNSVTVVQQVKVRPQISFGPDQISAEGATVTVRVYLNGPAAEYPVTVPFTVGGTTLSDGSDHDLVSGSLVINSGTETQFSFNLVDDGANEGTETVEIQLGSADNAVDGMRTSHLVSIREDNVAPRVRLQASQGGVAARRVVVTDGVVEVSALAEDVNGDALAYDWSGSDVILVDSDVQDDTFTFDPAVVPTGLYRLAVQVDDGVEQGTASLLLDVVADAPALATGDSDEDGVDDVTEGAGDSDQDGVAEYLDAIAAMNVLQSNTDNQAGFLVEAEPGLALGLSAGSFAVADGAAVTPREVADAFNVALPGALRGISTESFFDVQVSALGAPGDAVSVVLPLARPVPFGGRLYLLTSVDWVVAVSADGNQVASAHGAAGYCPPPASALYKPGVATGAHCLRVTLVDGGTYDGDGVADGTVLLRGGISIPPPSVIDNDDDDGLLGAAGQYLLLLLGMLGWRRRVTKR